MATPAASKEVVEPPGPGGWRQAPGFRCRLDGSWRFAKRHKVRAMIFNTSRSDSREFEQDIEWEDEVFPVGARIKGEVDFAVYQVAYEYLFLRRESWELGASIGVHYLGIATLVR